MTIYLVVVKDRYSGAGYRAFTKLTRAIATAKENEQQSMRHYKVGPKALDREKYGTIFRSSLEDAFTISVHQLELQGI